MTTGIYTITNTANGKRYVGCSENIELRWRQHLYYMRNDYDKYRPIKRDFKTYGESAFRLEVIEVCSVEELVQREQEYIDRLRPEYNSAKTACRKGRTAKRI